MGCMSVDWKSSPWSHFVLTVAQEPCPLDHEKGGISALIGPEKIDVSCQ